MDSMDVLDWAMEHLQGARRYERYVAALCPFHDDTSPSMLVFRDGYTCKACGAHGLPAHLMKSLGARALVPVVEKPTYYPTIDASLTNEQLVRSANRVLSGTPGLQDYLIRRKVERAISLYGLGYLEGWYTVPVRDREGVCQQVIFRAGPWIQAETGTRFYQRRGQKISLYVPDWSLLQPGRTLFIVFGLFDALTLALLRYPVCSATAGKDLFKPEWISFWEGPVVIIPDKMEETEAYQLASKLGWRGHVYLPSYPDNCKDPNDLAQHDLTALEGKLHELDRNFTDRFWTGDQGALFPRRSPPASVGTALPSAGAGQEGQSGGWQHHPQGGAVNLEHRHAGGRRDPRGG